jgi:hypothetical protein
MKYPMQSLVIGVLRVRFVILFFVHIRVCSFLVIDGSGGLIKNYCKRIIQREKVNVLYHILDDPFISLALFTFHVVFYFLDAIKH